MARKSALSLRAKQNELIVLDALQFEAPKTKAMVEVMKVAGTGKKVLFVTAENDLNVIKSAANIQRTNVVTANEPEHLHYHELECSSADRGIGRCY